MKTLFKLTMKMAILVVLLTGGACSGPKNGKFNTKEGWTLSPENNGPWIVSTGHKRGVFIGQDENGNDGASNSKVSQTFKCSNRNGEWCVVSITADLKKRESTERIKITLQGESASHTAYLKYIDQNAWNYKISVPGCGKVTFTMEMTGGNNPGLQSTAFINDISSYCSDRKIIKNLVDATGNELTGEE